MLTAVGQGPESRSHRACSLQWDRGLRAGRVLTHTEHAHCSGPGALEQVTQSMLTAVGQGPESRSHRACSLQWDRGLRAGRVLTHTEHAHCSGPGALEQVTQSMLTAVGQGP